MTVEDDGKIHYFLSRRKPNTTRGKKVILLSNEFLSFSIKEDAKYVFSYILR